MRKIVLAAAIGTLALAACSQETQDAAEQTADSAAADTAANVDAAGEAVDNAADAASPALRPATLPKPNCRTKRRPKPTRIDSVVITGKGVACGLRPFSCALPQSTAGHASAAWRQTVASRVQGH